MVRTYATVLFLGVTSIAAAQTPAPSDPSAGSMPQGAMMRPSAPTAAEFVSKAGQDGMTEVQVAQLALQKAQSDDVKKFAQQMVTDHTKANTELMAIASNKHLMAPSQLDAEHQSMVQGLSSKSGTSFDMAYVSQMVVAHDKAIALFTAAKASTDPDIAAFATKTLPTLQMHKQMVTKLQSAHAM